MALGSSVQGRLVGHDSYNYSAFDEVDRDGVKTGRTVDGGTVHHVFLADPDTLDIGRYKVNEAMWGTLQGAGFGAIVQGVTRPFAKNGRVETALVELTAPPGAPIKL